MVQTAIDGLELIGQLQSENALHQKPSDQHGKKINQTMCNFEARYNGKDPMGLLTDFL